MYVSLWNQPSHLFGQFELLRRELDEVFGVSGLPSGKGTANEWLGLPGGRRI
jgi:HSP20 family protein